MAITTYDPKKVVVSFLGNLLTGFTSGSFVTVARAVDGFTLKVGADGKGTRVRSSNRSGTITINLDQTSPSNDVLSAAAAADELGGVGVGPFFLKDSGGRTLAVAQSAWVKKMPSVDFSDAAGSRAWVLETDELVVFAGGN